MEEKRMSIKERSFIDSMNTKIDNQELRILERSAQEMQEQYENAKKREAEASQMLSIERARCKTQELEIDRRRRQVEESSNFIKKLQAELEDARQTASGVKWELRENEIKSIREDEVIHYKMLISGLEAKLKKKQMDFDAIRELLKQHHKSKEKEIFELKTEMARKEKKSEETISEFTRNTASLSSFENREKLDVLHERIGSLTANNETLQDKINGMQAEKFEAENKLRYAEEDKCSLQRQIDSLKDQLTDSEGASYQTSSYLTDEIDKIKHQKAQLRCEYLQLKRNFSQLEADNKALNDKIATYENCNVAFSDQLKGVEQEKQTILIENSELRTQLSAMQDSILEYQKKIEDGERYIKESEASDEAKGRQFSTELEQYSKKMGLMRQALVELDAQCERLMVKLKSVDQEKKGVQQDNRLLQKELEEMRKSTESQCKMKNDYAAVCEENARLTHKVTYLENELKESHTDHRNELTRIARQVTLVESDAPEAENLCKANELQTLLKQQESHNRYLERSVEQLKKELEAANKEISELSKRQCDLINDNTVLRQALAEALKKCEQYRDQSEELKRSNESLMADSNFSSTKILHLEDEMRAFRVELDQKEKLIGYLQSVQQPKQMQKLKRNRSSYSTLISAGNDTASISDLEMESKQCEELQRERDRLLSNLDKQRRVLFEKQNEVVPLLKNSKNNFALSASKDLQMPIKTPTKKSVVPAQSPHVGTMRHDIPHRWKKQFVTITSTQCAVCYDGLPHFGHVYKCRECTLMVHTHCMPNIVNTCGMPSSFADYYLGAHSTAVNGAMNGWIKLWRSDDRAGNKWRNAWSAIDQNNRIFFYDSDSLAISNGPPFLSIDLDKEQWRIFNQTNDEPVAEGIVSRENMPLVIEIKLPKFSLFMLAPTVQAKQRWVRALQFATNRRIQRRASSNALIFSLFLELEKPQNLGIYCTQILDNEFLLIGSNEGLFATNAQSNPRAPFNVAGIPTVFFMELMPEHDMLLVICGTTRLLAAIHLQQLRHALRAEQPCVQYTTISNIDNCHIAVVSKPEHSQKRYVYLATADAIFILQFMEKIGAFSLVKQIKTDEPCMCICSTPLGFIYGADNFHIVTVQSNFSYVSLSIDNCPSDFPIAVIEITPDEFLLAFYNYGVFVTPDGKRKRNQNVDWDRIPLEFIYTAPYLYIVYCDFLEIARVATFESENSPGLTNDRAMFKCRSAHRTGSGIKSSDVMFAVSTEDRVELHVFHTSELEYANKSILKRKLADSLSRQSSKKKY